MQLFVPGSLCLFGEHSDWAAAYRPLNPAIAKGCTLIASTNQGIYAEVCRKSTAGYRDYCTGFSSDELCETENPFKKKTILGKLQILQSKI